jgi:hypothetical protein
LIAQRQEMFFKDFSFDPSEAAFRFGLILGDTSRDGLVLRLPTLAVSGALIEIGQKIFRAWNIEHTEILYWCTPDSIVYDHTHKKVNIEGLTDALSLMTFDLLYVGISKKDNAFTRLVANPHEKRIAILTNEYPLRPGARVSDEIYFFFFDVIDFHIGTFEPDGNADDLISMILNPVVPARPDLVADAEKAFVNVLHAPHNVVRFNKYPKGKDGLYGAGLARYGYVIDEDLLFTTDEVTIRGAYGAMLNEVVASPLPHDMIFIQDGEVTFVSSETMTAVPSAG